MAGAELSAPAIADFAAPGVTRFNATGQGKEVAVELTFEKTTEAGWSHGSSNESAVSSGFSAVPGRPGTVAPGCDRASPMIFTR
jgi:hypothetical protein